MKISTRLTIAGVTLVAAVSLMAAVLVWTSQTVRQELVRNQGAAAILDGVFSIRYLMQEYVLQHEERARVQWYSRDQSLANLLAAQATFAGAEDETLARLRKANDVVASLFSQVVENQPPNTSRDSNITLVQELEDRLTGQVMIRLEAMISDASTLSEQSREGVLKAQGREGMAVAIFSALMLLIFAI